MYNLSGPTRLIYIFSSQDTDLSTWLHHGYEINDSNEIAWKTSVLIIDERVYQLEATH